MIKVVPQDPQINQQYGGVNTIEFDEVHLQVVIHVAKVPLGLQNFYCILSLLVLDQAHLKLFLLN